MRLQEQLPTSWASSTSFSPGSRILQSAVSRTPAKDWRDRSFRKAQPELLCHALEPFLTSRTTTKLLCVSPSALAPARDFCSWQTDEPTWTSRSSPLQTGVPPPTLSWDEVDKEHCLRFLTGDPTWPQVLCCWQGLGDGLPQPPGIQVRTLQSRWVAL